jgi:hypothetical protein
MSWSARLALILMPKRSTLVDVGFVQAGTPVVLNVFYKSDSASTGMFELYAFAH